MGVYAILADSLCYPSFGRMAALQAGLSMLSDGVVKTAFNQFIAGITDLSLGEWEELYTRTLDLNPPAAPYIGYQTWGDSYQRGTFLSMMNRALAAHQVDSEGELPDHLIPVLRLLDALEEPFPELSEVLAPAVERIHAALAKAEPANPYLLLIEAISLACTSTARTPAPTPSKN